MRGPLLLLVACALLVPTAAAQVATQASQGATIGLFAHWPAEFSQATEQPIPLTTLPPLGEPDLSAGPAVPGASAADTMTTFTYTLINPNGSRGPYGDVALDPDRPVVLYVYLSADETAWPGVAGDPPADADYGAAPAITVDATLKMGGQAVSHAQQTQHLVSTPEEVGAPVQRYDLVLPLERTVLERGSGLDVEITIEQVDVEGQRAVQPFWNVHTGESYPTAVHLPVRPSDPGQEPLETFSTPEAQTRPARTVAVGVLVGSVIVAAVAGVRMLDERRGDES